MCDISSNLSQRNFSNWNRFVSFSIYKQLRKMISWWRGQRFSRKKGKGLKSILWGFIKEFFCESGNCFSEWMGKKIMHKQRYKDKINSLLEDTNIYKISNPTTINKGIIPSNKLEKKNSRRTKYPGHPSNPTNPTLDGLLKIHKPNTSLRPIISSIGSATHEIACALAKILTSTRHNQPLTRYKLRRFT